ncbi:MAG: hypothetical protein ACOC08_03000 [Campylobacterales bacterium]
MATVKKLFSLDSNTAKELELLAHALQKSQKEIVESALDFYFDHTDALMADKITDAVHSGKMRTHDSKSVYKELGIEL